MTKQDNAVAEWIRLVAAVWKVLGSSIWRVLLLYLISYLQFWTCDVAEHWIEWKDSTHFTLGLYICF